MDNVIKLDDKNLFIKRYKIRRTGRKGRTLETSIPREVFEREARRMDMSPEEAVDKLEAVWRFNAFPGLHLSFEKRTEAE